jgi:hypothetical protein
MIRRHERGETRMALDVLLSGQRVGGLLQDFPLAEWVLSVQIVVLILVWWWQR